MVWKQEGNSNEASFPPWWVVIQTCMVLGLDPRRQGRCSARRRLLLVYVQVRLQSRARPTREPGDKGTSGDFCVRVRVRVLGLVRVRVLVRVRRDGWGVEVQAGMWVVV